MYNLIIGICHVALRLRHVSSLKEKRNVFQSASTRLRKIGFSVIECGTRDNFKELHIGLALAARAQKEVQLAIQTASDLLRTDYEVLRVDQEIVDYEPSDHDLSLLVSPEDEVKD